MRTVKRRIPLIPLPSAGRCSRAEGADLKAKTQVDVQVDVAKAARDEAKPEGALRAAAMRRVRAARAAAVAAVRAHQIGADKAPPRPSRR